MRSGSISRARWSELEPLLDAALDLDPAERSAFLDSACRGNATLRAELGSLLADCALGATLLGEPAAVVYGPLIAEPPPPRLLGGRYHIVREIGRGGMSTVYLADDPKHARQVAVKTLQADVARVIGRERFDREIEIAASLSHPHILPLHDSGDEKSESGQELPLLYFVSPYVAGESLRDRLHRETRLPMGDVVRLGREIALGLDYAHRRGVIHLDIKPENILLQDGHAIIADFGIARAVSSMTDDGARSTMVVGTPRYMSPEQAAGAVDVDGRSDVYSLGCVLYELLTGERPETGVVAAPTAGTRELIAVIARAMAPAREDRFSTAGDLARALSGTAPERHRSRWRPRWLAGAAFAAAALGPLAFWTLERQPLDANLLAVAPFDGEGPSLALWKQGLVDVVSRSLDGAGPLRTLSASLVIRGWHGRADLESARALGRSTGAGLVLFGGLLEAGDSVRVRVSLLDVASGRNVSEIEESDLASRMDRLSDSLSVAVLRELGRVRRIDMAHATSSPTTSLAALKSYLQGEQFYRAALWDSAQTHFERAVMLDSTFALAYHRLAGVLRWRDPNFVPDSATFELMRKPSRFPRGLGPRERLLATIDSLSAETYFAWRRGARTAQYADESALMARLCATLIDAFGRYPDDAELRFLLAEAHTRFEGDVVEGEIDDRATLALYDRAIALDSSFAPGYVIPIALAGYLDGTASARRYIRAYLALDPSGPRSQIIRLADALLDPERVASIDVGRLVDTLSADRLCEATRLLRHVADAEEIAVRLARAMMTRSANLGAGGHEGSCAAMNAVDELQFRGHLRDADRLASTHAPWLRTGVLYSLASAGMVSPDTVRAEFKKILAFSPKTRITRLYDWWATDADTIAIRTYIDGFAGAQGTLHTVLGESMLRASVTAGRFYLALAKRDSAGALRGVLATKDTLHECWHENRLTIVKLLEAEGRYREAGKRLERRWPGTTACSNGFGDVLWTLERARVFERLGRRDQATTDYSFVIDAWRTADPELQPYVRESREALARLR